LENIAVSRLRGGVARPYTFTIVVSSTNQPNQGANMLNLDTFLTLENAIQYNNVTDKLVFIADELDISAVGRKVLEVEDQLIQILTNNNIEVK
jgi:hypothetical protein